jgi:hypothetical protein
VQNLQRVAGMSKSLTTEVTTLPMAAPDDDGHRQGQGIGLAKELDELTEHGRLRFADADA